MKKILTMLLIACCTFGTANAQFGKLKNLKNKVEKAAKKEVKEKTETVQAATSETITQKTSNLESYEKKQNDGTIVFTGDNLGMYAKAMKTDWDEVQTHVYDPNEWIAGTKVVEQNALYYLYKWKKACEAGDTEKMTGEVYSPTLWCVTQISNYDANEKYGLSYIDFKVFADDFNKSLDTFHEIMWAGSPNVSKSFKEVKTEADHEIYVKENFARWNWVLDKAEEAKAANKPYTMQFYLNYMVSQRELMLCWKYMKGNENGFAEFDNRLKGLLAETPSSFQKANKMLTPEECLAKQKAQEEKWAQERAAKEAARLAEIEKNTQDWPKSNMPELDAQILSIMKQKFPDRKILRVSVMNNKWNIMMKGLVPERRVVQFWAEFEEKGMRFAEEHYVCQYYNGNSYGKTQYQSRGTRFFYVRQK